MMHVYLDFIQFLHSIMLLLKSYMAVAFVQLSAYCQIPACILLVHGRIAVCIALPCYTVPAYQ